MDEINKSNTPINKNIIEKWQTSRKTIKERFTYLFNNEKLSDIHFIVGRDKKHRIPAHKIVLAASSDVFETMFYGSLPTKSDQVELPDIEPSEFLSFLQFIYSDEAKLDQETVMSTIYVAKKYNVPTLKDYCDTFLKNNVDSNHAILLLMQARFLDEPQLADFCLGYIDGNAEKALLSEDFTDMDLDTLKMILKRDTLQIDEIKLFVAILEWTKEECARKQLSLSPENQRLVLGPAFFLIRFPLMSLDEFNMSPVQSGLLNDREIRNLISYLTENPKPLVEFSAVPRHCETLLGKRYRVGRFLVSNTTIWDYDNKSTEPHWIRFMVDRRIFIIGFGLYGPVSNGSNNEFEVDIQLLHAESNTLCASNQTSYKPNGSCTTYEVLLKEPIEIISNTNYAVCIEIKRKIPYMWCGKKGYSKVSFKDSKGYPITFEFSSTGNGVGVTDAEKGQIPEIIYYT